MSCSVNAMLPARCDLDGQKWMDGALGKTIVNLNFRLKWRLCLKCQPRLVVKLGLTGGTALLLMLIVDDLSRTRSINTNLS